jgi:hypothetical protein
LLLHYGKLEEPGKESLMLLNEPEIRQARLKPELQGEPEAE